MATIPSFEKTLLELQRSLGISGLSKKNKDKLIQLDKPLKAHFEAIENLIHEIFNALGMDTQAQSDAVMNILELANCNSIIEHNTWTFEADIRQVVWHIAGNIYAPHLGRRIAFWTMHERLDKGMSGGKFWYLPISNEKTGHNQLIMPITQVIDWLLDLLGKSFSDDSLNLGGGEGLNGAAKVAKIDSESITRALFEWHKGSTLPKVDTIERYFSEGSKLDFKGAFTLDNKLNNEQQFQNALLFVKKKNLGVDALKHEIPLIQTDRLREILGETASDDEKATFVEYINERFSPPSLHTIRQRLLIARACQDGYQRLGQLLNGKEFNKYCADPGKNKVLQLILIYQHAYNLTIDAKNNCNSEDEENIWYEDQLTYFEKEGIYLSTIESRSETRMISLAEDLTNRFLKLKPGDPLEDLILYDEKQVNSMMLRDVLRIKNKHEDYKSAKYIINKFQTHSPWRILNEVDSYNAVCMIANNPAPSIRIRDAVFSRMRELAHNPKERMIAILLELRQILDIQDHKLRKKDDQEHVIKLLNEADKNSSCSLFKAPILQYKAKHLLSLNEFEKAHEFFKEARENCKTNSFGKLRGEISRNAFALFTAHQLNGFHLPNCEPYYRDMLAYGGFEGMVSDTSVVLDMKFEDIAYKVSEYFWTKLYHPYSGINYEPPPEEKQCKHIFDGTHELIINGNKEELKRWLKNNSRFRNIRLKGVRGDTILMMWIKLLYTNESENILQQLSSILTSDQQHELDSLRSFLSNMRTFICMIIDNWRKIVDLSDFKSQTPLIMAANQGDFETLSALLNASANTSNKDFMGRTALHAASTARSLECVEALLLHNNSDITAQTHEGNTALHLAVRSGHPGIVRKLLEYDTDHKDIQNNNNLTPIDLAQELLRDPETMKAHRQYMASHNRKTGSINEYKEIVSAL